MTNRTLGSDQMRAVVSVIDKIIQARAISDKQAELEMGIAGKGVLAAWRNSAVGMGAERQYRVRKWILDWKHVLPKRQA